MKTRIVSLIVLSVLVAGCKPATDQASSPVAATEATPPAEQPAEAPVQLELKLPSNEAVAVTEARDPKIPLEIKTGQSLSGSFTAPKAGDVVGIDVFIGNYRNRSDGRMDVELCSENECVSGSHGLVGTRDNRMMTIVLAKPLAVGALPVRYTFAKVGGKQRVAIWAAPTSTPGNPMTDADGQSIEREPQLTLRYAKKG